MAGNGKPRPGARAEPLPFPGGRPTRSALRFAPSTRSLLVGLALVGAAAAGYVAARETSVFAVRAIEVRGVPPPVAARVRTALAPLLGTSLVAFEPDAADQRLAALPDVAAARYDRDFPHILRVFVRAERPVAVLRQGAEAWLVSARARVLRPMRVRPYPPLPRIWLPRTTDLSPGAALSGDAEQAVRAAAHVARSRFPGDVRTVTAGEGELTLVLASGREVRLGDGADLPLKLTIAGRILPLAESADYVDVSVPERPVAGAKN